MRAITLSQVLQLLEERQAGVVTVDRLAVYTIAGSVSYTSTLDALANGKPVQSSLMPFTNVCRQRSGGAVVSQFNYGALGGKGRNPFGLTP